MIARRTFASLLAASVVVTALGACATRTYNVTGTVSYRERLILPADSQVVVRLDDISRGPSYPATISEQRVTPNSAAATTFALPYEYGTLNPNATYVVNAWVEQGGRVLFRNAKVYPVLTKTAPSSNIHVELEQVTAMMVPAPTTTVMPANTGTVIVQPAPVAPPPGTVILQPR
jgi:putative lipoprotein